MKRDFDELERRRLKAAELLAIGLTQAQVARDLGVRRQSVNRWAKELRDGGPDALKKAVQAGRKFRLSESDLERVKEVLRCPIKKTIGATPELRRTFEFRWTPGAVAELIERECGVRYTVGHVRRIIKALGWKL